MTTAKTTRILHRPSLELCSGINRCYSYYPRSTGLYHVSKQMPGGRFSDCPFSLQTSTHCGSQTHIPDQILRGQTGEVPRATGRQEGWSRPRDGQEGQLEH
ncbi:uncharacterized protein LOC144874517 [Branchiostoma floridae x Branchiostoma japonicum]